MDIDLIIPMHNGGATIGAALASLRAQTNRRWRALVIDDGSTDGGPATVEAVAAVDPRVRLIRQARSGVAAARNRGLDLADAPLTMFLDADDWLLPEALGVLAETASDDAAAFGGFEFRDADGRWLADERPAQGEIGLRELFGQVFLVVHAQALPRRAIGDERFDSSLAVVEDTDVWLRLARRGLRWRNTNALLGAYRVRPSARSTDFEMMLACSRRVYERGAAAGVEGRGIAPNLDASVLARVHCSAALAYSTRAALADGEGGVERGAAMMRSVDTGPGLSPTQLAVMARQAVLMALGRRPGDDDAPWRGALEAWWRRCRDERWCTDSTLTEARARLESLRGPGVAAWNSARVSVVVPLYQSGATVEAALESVTGAGIDDVECIVVNDGSDDDGPARVQRLAERDRRFTLVHRLNGGLGAARNTGIDLARGRWLHVLDADDWLLPGGLAALVRAAEAGGAGTRGAIGGCVIRDSAGQAIGTHRPDGPLDLDALLEGRLVVCHGLLLDRAALGATRFDPGCRRVEDYDLWLRLAEDGWTWAPVDAEVCAYRVSAAGLSRSSESMLAGASAVYRASLDRLARRGDSARASAARRAGIDRRLALVWATRRAVAQGDVEGSLAMLDAVEHGAVVGPSEAAACAADAVVLGRGEPLVIDGRAECAWAPALLEFWRGCELRGWSLEGLCERAATLLAERAVGAAAVMERIERACGDCDEVLLIGYGRNGRALSAHLRAAGRRVSVRDDAAAQGGVRDGVEFEPMDSPIGGGRAAVITPTDDAGLWARFAGRVAPGQPLVRWRIEAEALARAGRSLLMAKAGARR